MGKARTVEDLKNLSMETEMPDGRLWIVPVMVIAQNRAENYKKEFGNDLKRSLEEDTLPLFADDEYEIQDWAQNNMNWSDVEAYASEIETIRDEEPDYQEGWMNGRKSFLTSEPDPNHVVADFTCKIEKTGIVPRPVSNERIEELKAFCYEAGAPDEEYPEAEVHGQINIDAEELLGLILRIR